MTSPTPTLTDEQIIAIRKAQVGRYSACDVTKPYSDSIAFARAILAALPTGGAGPWRCFHCDEIFDDADSARLHFGPSEYSKPICQLDAAHVRDLELRLDAYCQEDTELHRAMYGMQCRHRTALLREEEKGYARGLADASSQGGAGEVPRPPKRPAGVDIALNMMRETKGGDEVKLWTPMCWDIARYVAQLEAYAAAAASSPTVEKE